MDTDDGYCESAPDGEWVWNERLVSELLGDEDGDVLFVAGCASNQSTFYDRFDLVVLLSAPVGVMLERIASREGNPFGKAPEERSRILGDLDDVEPLLRAVAGAEIRTDQPLGAVVDEVLARAATL